MSNQSDRNLGTEARLKAVFQREQSRGIEVATWARLIALGSIFAWVALLDQNGENAAGYLGIAIVACNGLALWALHRTRLFRPWMLFASVAFDHVAIATVMITPIIIGGEALSPAMGTRSVWFDIYFLMIASSVMVQRPALVVWSGLTAALSWSAVVIHALRQPGTFTMPLTWLWSGTDAGDFVRVMMNPRYIDLTNWLTQVLLLILVALTLAAAVRRAKTLLVNQAAAECERANLARYFSPDMVERLASSDSPLSRPNSRVVAVLFADLTGFTRLCENAPAAEIIDLLRQFRIRMEKAVFTHGGTVDKYIGDCVMATFGLLAPSGRDPAAALGCAHDMQDAVNDWNRDRAVRGLPSVGLGIGVHYGAVVAGDIGSDQRLEFTVIGDTVNVASRLMHLTRELEAGIVISDEVAGAALVTDGEAALAGYRRVEEMPLRGRDGTVALWYRPLATGSDDASCAA
ncbi:adenylate/guanylate cyclase domain-containing protein [Niveispirillum sp. KHB5.9]|uniref:adenylate/guanylate cyclase domain-containing protein n=1 Tax=Niveispirillum sp. KHB5.9 TaxID=3400269 RepID=UPI003A885EBA